MAETNRPYPKGSEWRRWDLQTQTILDDSYVQLSDYSEELKTEDPTRWQDYVSKVGGEENALKFDSKAYFNDTTIDKTERCRNYVRNLFAFLEVYSPELACIGITDHNYYDDKLLDVFIDYSKRNRLSILPGVEINCGGIHLLLFFPKILYGKDTYSAGIHAFLTKFGIDSRTNGEGRLTTTTADIKEILDETKKQGGVVIYPHCNSNNGLFQERTATDRTNLADIFNHQKVNLLQTQNDESAKTVTSYIESNQYLTSQFCTHISSDGRALRDFGRADKDGNYLWIKADPTFEGLKQIIFESKQRIYVGPSKPEGKKPYFVIDKIRFLDNSEKLFSSDVIEVNQNLTTIIGGKSTGKSLLLYYTAKTIDPTEVEERTSMVGPTSDYDFDTSPDFNFEVTWCDGQTTLLKSPEHSAEEDGQERKILYIPQKYLNTLSETNIKSREALNEFVLDVIRQDEGISEQYDETTKEIRNDFKRIQLEIGELFTDAEDINNTEEELKQSGNEQGIRTYIETLEKDIADIKAKSGLSTEDLNEYETLTSREKEIETSISNLESDKKVIKNIADILEARLSDIENTADEFESFINDDDTRKQLRAEFVALEPLRPTIKAIPQKLVSGIDGKLATLKKEQTEIKSKLAPLVAKVKLQNELKTKTDLKKAEEKKIDEIAIKTKALASKRESYKKKKEAVIQSYSEVFGKYESLRNEFKKFESRFGDISLGVHVGFDDESFNNEVISQYVNKSDLKRIIPETDWGEEFVYQYDPTKHISNMTLTFSGLLEGKVHTIKNQSVRDAVTKLLDDYFFLDFRIFYRNDSLDKMSPGKKGFVLLQLLINLSDEEWPILLDQPEDDLDNRSVYDDLVAFLKEKKSHRQIIIVTHNPNLVVGSDAEETVVANQSGQEVGRDNRKYRFEYVSGALENDFELTPAEESAILFRKGIRQHVCEILEGGKEAFQKREQKYDFSD